MEYPEDFEERLEGMRHAVDGLRKARQEGAEERAAIEIIEKLAADGLIRIVESGSDED